MGDIGSTRACFAWQASAATPPTCVTVSLCDEHDGLQTVIRPCLWTHGKPSPRGRAIANPITGDTVRMSHQHGSLLISGQQRELKIERLAVVNDSTALAFSLPGLMAAAMGQVGPGKAAPGLRRHGNVSAERALSGPGW